MAGAKQQLDIEGRRVPVSNLDKVLYPAAHFTKGHVIDYYIRAAPYIIPHLKDRPVTLKRFPDGVRGDFFYEKDAPGFTPEWIRTFPVPRRGPGADIRYVVVDDVPTLVWLANVATLELHPFLHRVPDLDHPTSIVLDLDPGEGADILRCAQVGLIIREVLDELRLQSFAKVSGSKGIQLYIPLNTPIRYEETQAFARALAELLEQRHRDLVVSQMHKHLRTGKVFIDWSQNSDFKTTVAAYSLRAKTGRPFVSVPITWDELQTALDHGLARSLSWAPEEALERFARVGDLFAPVEMLEQSLPPEVASYLKPSAALTPSSGKRDFAKPSEPASRRSRQGSRRLFVIQKHAASHLHYDFRLQIGETLKSWVVTKGLPYKLSEPRLAMPAEDHPLDYAGFEGIIPKGQYGGGTAMVWDIGTYELIEGSYSKGVFRIQLNGKKLKGQWTLARRREQGRTVWFVRKSDKNMRAPAKNREDRSALSNRSMEEIAVARNAVWHRNRRPPGLDDLPQSNLDFVEPMLATLVARLPDGPEWTYELKLDGYRAIAVKHEDRVTLYSRRGHSLNDRFPGIAAALTGLPEGTIVDGEVVALDKDGRPSFTLLQHSKRPNKAVYYYVFDLLAYSGKDTRELPLSERRRLLDEFIMPALQDPVRQSSRLDAAPAEILAAVRRQGLEGVMAKLAGSPYRAGQRAEAWVKVKTNKSRELVIGGYLPGRQVFESLLAGYYDGSGRLLFIAKIKNGLTPALRREVAGYFDGLEADQCPFANLPEPKNARRGEALTAEVLKKCRWLKPELVAQVEFTDWTAAGHLRHSRFAGLRDDKAAREVTHDKPA